ARRPRRVGHFEFKTDWPGGQDFGDRIILRDIELAVSPDGCASAASGWPHIVGIKPDSVVVVIRQSGIVRDRGFVVLLIEAIYDKIRDALRQHVDSRGNLAGRLYPRAVHSIGGNLILPGEVVFTLRNRAPEPQRFL